MVFLWFFLKDITIGSLTIKGWPYWIGLPEPIKYVKESTIAILIAFLLFLFPSKNKKGMNIITWSDVSRLPLGVIFLFGGGFALAEGVKVSGLSQWIAEEATGLADLNVMLLILGFTLFMTFLTELTSNTASVVLFVPILFAMEPQLDCHPLQLYIPVTLAASCAFMLPVATPPNTIVFGSERLTIRQMMRAGIWLNLIAVAIITLVSYTIISWVFAS